MKHSTIATRYARALLELAAEQHRIDVFGEQVKDFLEALHQKPNLIQTLDDHHMSDHERLDLVLKVMGDRGYDPLVKNFFFLVAKKRRVVSLAAIYEKYCALADQALGRQPVTLTSATALSDAETNHVIDLLAKRFHKKMIVTKKVDPSLLGGLRAFVGDHVFDYTLKRQLEDLNKMIH